MGATVKVRGATWNPVGDPPPTVGGRRRRSRVSPHSAIVVRPAAFHPGVVHLRLDDDSIVPTVDDIRKWVDAIRLDPTVTTIRTSALFPKSADRFQAGGFDVVDTLSLLRADLAGRPVRSALDRRRANARAGTATLRHRDYVAAAIVDRAAFGPSWGHDAVELAEIRHATPSHRARCRFTRSGPFTRSIEAFAIAGASSEHGYLQRLSVDPRHQRGGHGRQLTLDALGWMARRGLPDCLVNTSVNNVSALALYDALGFRAVRDQLRVLHYDVRPAS